MVSLGERTWIEPEAWSCFYVSRSWELFGGWPETDDWDSSDK